MICVSAILPAQAGLRPVAVPVHRIADSPAPSGRARASGTLGEAEAVTLVVRSHGRERLRATDVQGFGWVPGARTSLLYAASGLYGSGGLFLWTPAGRRELVPVRRPRSETFTLVGATLSNRSVRVRYLHRRAEATVAHDEPGTVTVRLRRGE